ncbi:KH domain-containing protein [Alicyclobacillus sp.]|uniref:KH domain-containing protein n=1 Tax=Alicyclobacillus sp. TaxID=61169 RepID=UPI0025B7AFA5|nr:KH domain-containing protein [Alicyclobacillus sp.]MCL6516455.1 KH domain-containing protein [Alicyclobacillus sp.]
MKELVEFLAKSLVSRPEAVVVTEEQRGDTWVYRVSVHPEDTGRIIGRHGRIAKAIRSVVSAAAHRERRQVQVDIDA